MAKMPQFFAALLRKEAESVYPALEGHLHWTINVTEGDNGCALSVGLQKSCRFHSLAFRTLGLPWEYSWVSRMDEEGHWPSSRHPGNSQPIL